MPASPIAGSRPGSSSWAAPWLAARLRNSTKIISDATGKWAKVIKFAGRQGRIAFKPRACDALTISSMVREGVSRVPGACLSTGPCSGREKSSRPSRDATRRSCCRRDRAR